MARGAADVTLPRSYTIPEDRCSCSAQKAVGPQGLQGAAFQSKWVIFPTIPRRIDNGPGDQLARCLLIQLQGRVGGGLFPSQVERPLEYIQGLWIEERPVGGERHPDRSCRAFPTCALTLASQF